MTQPQYLRGGPRARVHSLLEALPRWTDVRIRGSEPREIRSVEQLVGWLDSYRTRVVEKLATDLDEARDKAKGFKANRDQLVRGIAALGLDLDDVLAADPWIAARAAADAAGTEQAARISGRDAAAGPDS